MKLKKRSQQKQRNFKKVDTVNLQKNNYYRSTKSTNSAASFKDKETNKDVKKRFGISSFINILLIVGAMCLVVFATTLNNSPIVEVTSNKNIVFDVNEYEEESKSILDGNLLNKSKILFQQNDFATKLKDKFPEINTVEANVPLGGRSLAVFLSLSEPFARVYSGEQTGIINSEGILVKTNINDDSANELLGVRFTQPQENFQQGSRILTTLEVDLLRTLNQEMTSLVFKNGSTASIEEVLFNVADGQIEAKLEEKTFFIKLSSFNDGDVQVGGAKATLKQLDDEDSLPTEYIDVRVPGRAFVK